MALGMAAGAGHRPLTHFSNVIKVSASWGLSVPFLRLLVEQQQDA